MPIAGSRPNQKKTACPQCGKPAVLDADNPWRPFCSERCKLLDLGEWFSGRYAVPSAENEDASPEDGTLQ